MIKDVKNPVSRPIDHYLFYHDKLNVYAIKMENGNICDIYKTDSTVQKAEKQDMTGYV
jgi:pyocin large subunit-like protein